MMFGFHFFYYFQVSRCLMCTNICRIKYFLESSAQFKVWSSSDLQKAWWKVTRGGIPFTSNNVNNLNIQHYPLKNVPIQQVPFRDYFTFYLVFPHVIQYFFLWIKQLTSILCKPFCLIFPAFSVLSSCERSKYGGSKFIGITRLQLIRSTEQEPSIYVTTLPIL